MSAFEYWKKTQAADLYHDQETFPPAEENIIIIVYYTKKKKKKKKWMLHTKW